MKTTDFIKEDIGEDAHAMHQDHEVQMARSDCYNSAKYAIELHKMLHHIGEQQGLDGWVSEKITLANDYLRTVWEYLRHEGGEEESMVLPEFTFESAEAEMAKALNEKITVVRDPGQVRPGMPQGRGDVYIPPNKSVSPPKSPEKPGKLEQGMAEGSLEKTATGLKHHRDFPDYPGSKVSRLQSVNDKLDKVTTGRLDKALDVHWDRINKRKEVSGDPSGVAESEEHSPVANAVTRRIMMQRADLLAKYGPEKVMAAIDNVADFVVDVEEIGSSDVSAWVNQVERELAGMHESKKPVSEMTAGGTGAGGFATGPAGGGFKKTTGVPKKVGNVMKRIAPKVGKGIY